jgi:hypothetical protein
MAPNSAIVAAGVGATFHLLRLVCDLVSVASNTDAKHDGSGVVGGGENENANDDDDKRGRQLGMSTARRRLSVWNINGRLSMRNVRESTSNGTTWSPPPAYVDAGRRGSFLSRMLSTTTAFSPRGGSSTAGGGGGGGGDAEDQLTDDAEGPKVGLEGAMPPLSLMMHVGLFAYFVTATILSSSPPTSSGHDEFVYAAYDSVPLGCASCAIGFGLILNLRDYARRRFTSLQRGLYSISALILLLGCIVLLAFPPPPSSSSSIGTIVVDDIATPTIVDYVTLSCLIVYAILAITEGRVCRYPRVITKEGKKAKLNKRMLLTILKPYFWPHATATSAAINRVRAITTWLCVASAKACSLSSPIYLGKALTALTRSDYELTIRYAVYYALLQLASSTFKECQSLVYLKVAQAAFVQLSEETFQHLLNLSLDWHLIKKLGEVIRSMDRGIAACDSLMKYCFLMLIPAIFECIMVTIIFATYFDCFSLAVAVFFFVFAYVVLTILLTLWRRRFRKQMAKSDNDWHDKCTDSLINFETVKYFTAEEFEIKR